jgi:hypothetical protein
MLTRDLLDKVSRSFRAMYTAKFLPWDSNVTVNVRNLTYSYFVLLRIHRSHKQLQTNKQPVKFIDIYSCVCVYFPLITLKFHTIAIFLLLRKKQYFTQNSYVRLQFIIIQNSTRLATQLYSLPLQHWKLCLIYKRVIYIHVHVYTYTGI